MAAYAVTPSGNFEGKNILGVVGALDLRPALAEARRKLFEVREKRVHPGRDDQLLTSWNGLMLTAFAKAARVLDRDDYCLVAENDADFLLRELRDRRIAGCCGHGKLVLSMPLASIDWYLHHTSHPKSHSSHL